MAKFNKPSQTILTTNAEGHAAYAMPERLKLVTQVLTSFFREEKFYGDNSDDLIATLESVIRKDPEFVSKLAVYARRVFNMRSVSHVLVCYLAHEPAGKPFVRNTVRGVVQRGDDATEILSFYLSTFGKPIPNALRKGLEDVFLTFDEYTLAKYKGTSHALKMRDVLCLTRPKPQSEEQSAMWKRLLEDRLTPPLTWETQLSANGNTRETWEALIDSGKVGYMALLRNLRNIINAQPSNIEKVFAQIESPEAVRASRQLPFRFLSAYKSLPANAGSRALDALEAAAEASIGNMEQLEGTTVIAVDSSGSMSSLVSGHSTVRCCEIGTMLGLLANRICQNSIFYTFDYVIRQEPVSRRQGMLYMATHLSRANGGTNMDLPFQQMIHDRVKADRLIIISDNMCNMGETAWYKTTVQTCADRYRRESGRDIWVHAIDLMGYGTQQFHGPKTNIIAGWSEKVLQFISLAERGAGSLEAAIDGYSW